MYQWTDQPAVAAWLKLTNPDAAELAQLTLCIGAANGLAGRYLDDPAGDEPSPAGRLGATMLAARLWRRRNSPEGVAQITPDGALYVARTDPDIARLLQIDAATAPRVG